MLAPDEQKLSRKDEEKKFTEEDAQKIANNWYLKEKYGRE
jgi:hypothetical protein